MTYTASNNTHVLVWDKSTKKIITNEAIVSGANVHYDEETRNFFAGTLQECEDKIVELELID